MELPTIPEMRNDCSVIVKNLERLIEFFASKDELSQEEYLTQFGSIAIGLVRLDTKMGLMALNSVNQPNSKVNRQYEKAYKELWKILKKLWLGTVNIEKRYLEVKFNRFLPWEHIYKTTEMRNDIRNHLKGVLKDLIKLQKKI